MIDDSQDTPRDETPDAGAADEGTEPTAAPDEPPAAEQPTAADEPPAEEPTPADEEPAAEEPAPPAEEPKPAEEPVAEERVPGETEEPAAEEPAPAEAEEPAPAAEEPVAEEPAPAEAEEAAPPAEEPAAEQPATEAPPAEERARGGRRRQEEKAAEPEVIPGAHLEPDLVLDQPAEEADEYAIYAEEAEGEPLEGEAAEAEPAPAARTPLELAADARYQATGKRKTSVARVILKPGTGVYLINGRQLDVYFPRPRLQRQARQPLEATGNDQRMDVVARIHGGGVAAQAGALRHGIARALVEAEPSLRLELKRRGFLTRDPREKERRKAGLKKARKRPQFSKR
jgi:small subunit ribosomal protein S9